MNHPAFIPGRLSRSLPRALPAALLIGAISLSLSTACFTYSDSTPNPSTSPRKTEPVPASPDLGFLHSVHLKNPAIAFEPNAIAAALAPVLPPPLPGGRHGGNQINVTWVEGQPTKPEYRIEAYGDFNREKAQEFMTFCGQVRGELPPDAWLIVFVYRDPEGQASLVTWQEIK